MNHLVSDLYSPIHEHLLSCFQSTEFQNCPDESSECNEFAALNWAVGAGGGVGILKKRLGLDLQIIFCMVF